MLIALAEIIYFAADVTFRYEIERQCLLTASSGASGAHVPIARLRRPRRRTMSFSSR